jgi:cytochrome c oxidase subunit III
MQSSAPNVNVPVGTQPPKFAAHFATLDVQNHAARLGMWLFLSTEVLLFAGLFACYAFYRFTFPEAFAQGSRHLDLMMGTVNTVVLITSSFTAAMAVHYAKESNNKLVTLMMALTLLMAVGFLVIKGFEYHHKFEEHTLPGKYYAGGIQVPGITLFYTVYFMATGLHAFHVIIGMGVLAWVMGRAAKNHFNHANYTAVELGSMYWHLVDLVWIFLFPMLYLI